jgi:hypothetical protein
MLVMGGRELVPELHVFEASQEGTFISSGESWRSGEEQEPSNAGAPNDTTRRTSPEGPDRAGMGGMIPRSV